MLLSKRVSVSEVINFHLETVIIPLLLVLVWLGLLRSSRLRRVYVDYYFFVCCGLMVVQELDGQLRFGVIVNLDKGLVWVWKNSLGLLANGLWLCR